jgi:hypothetical protein
MSGLPEYRDPSKRLMMEFFCGRATVAGAFEADGYQVVSKSPRLPAPHHRLSSSDQSSAVSSSESRPVFRCANHTARDNATASDIEDRFHPTILCDFRRLCPHALLRTSGRPDFLWFSPPCETFSQLNRKPRTARDYSSAVELVKRCSEPATAPPVIIIHNTVEPGAAWWWWWLVVRRDVRGGPAPVAGLRHRGARRAPAMPAAVHTPHVATRDLACHVAVDHQ